MTDELRWIKAFAGNQWVLSRVYVVRGSDGQTWKRRETVMRIHPDYRLTPRKRIFLGWKVYECAVAGTSGNQVGPRIWQLQKAKDFAETVWRMSSG